MAIKYSIIIPCFNEGQVIAEVVTNLKTSLEQHAEASYEIIEVDDCTTDDTAAILKKLEGTRSGCKPCHRWEKSLTPTGPHFAVVTPQSQLGFYTKAADRSPFLKSLSCPLLLAPHLGARRHGQAPTRQTSSPQRGGFLTVHQ